MSVLSYLENLEKKLRLSENEETAIDLSINALKLKLRNWFGNQIDDIFVFGSYKRHTNLCRKADENSDVDIMIVFNNPSYKPQTYIEKLKNFMEIKYSLSEIHQSSPCAILELCHIRFELTPAISVYGNKYWIPNKRNSYSEWIIAEPFAIDYLSNLKKHNMYKQVTRLVKYWNVLNKKWFESFELEELVLNSSFIFDYYNLKDNLFHVLNQINYSYNAPQYIKDYIDKTKQIIQDIQENERFYLGYCESKIKELFKDL